MVERRELALGRKVDLPARTEVVMDIRAKLSSVKKPLRLTAGKTELRFRW